MATAARPAEAASRDRLAGTAGRLAGAAGGLPPVSFFLVSAVFHYLGPALAVLLFAHVAALGVMWLRIAAAAVVFAVWRRPWRLARRLSRRRQARLALLGGVLAGMNTLFYLAIARLPLATVGAIEFLGTIVLAAAGARTRRNAAALALTVGGVVLLTVIQLAAQPLGFVFAFGNCACFMAYVIVGHRVANTHGSAGRAVSGIDQLAAAMIIAAVIAAPAGLGSFPTSPISSPWPPCPGPASRCCSPCSPRSPSSPARPFSARSPPPGTWPASRWSSPAWPSTAQAPGQPM
jgi:inner membrane transporter RhtA